MPQSTFIDNSKIVSLYIRVSAHSYWTFLKKISTKKKKFMPIKIYVYQHALFGKTLTHIHVHKRKNTFIKRYIYLAYQKLLYKIYNISIYSSDHVFLAQVRSYHSNNNNNNTIKCTHKTPLQQQEMVKTIGTH